MKNCPFCNQTIEKSTFLENSNFRVIYNLAPILPGHSLLIPKKHIKSILDFDNEMLADFFSIAQKATTLLKKVYNCTGFNWSIQEGTEAGQSVEHLHLHIVVRKKGDLLDPGDWHNEIEKSKRILDSPDRTKLSESEIIETVNYIKSFI